MRVRGLSRLTHYHGPSPLFLSLYCFHWRQPQGLIAGLLCSRWFDSINENEGNRDDKEM